MKARPIPAAARRVEPEILDRLAADDPRAVASRRDLRRLNALMFHDAMIARLLRSHVAKPPRRILEIGCGDGSLMLSVARRLAGAWPAVEVTLLDRQALVDPATLAAFDALGWTARTVNAEIFGWSEHAPEAPKDTPYDAPYDAIAANLFLHHFEDAGLKRLLARLALLAPVFVATEPRRGALPLALSRMLRAIGAGEVTRHDAPASVRAGFAGAELTRLWPESMRARTEERRIGPLTHAFAAAS